MWKLVSSLNMSSIQGLYMYGMSHALLGMGGQAIGVRGVLGSIPGGTRPFDGVSFNWDRLEREDSEKVLKSVRVQEQN